MRKSRTPTQVLKSAGYTHKRIPDGLLLKLVDKDEHGATYIDEEKKFRWIKHESVKEL